MKGGSQEIADTSRSGFKVVGVRGIAMGRRVGMRLASITVALVEWLFLFLENGS